MQQIVIASNNPGKIQEFQDIFSGYGIEIIPQSRLMVSEIDEPYATFVENSLHKARHCSLISGLPSLADDSGLCVNALNGAPGIHSARYAGTPKSDTANTLKLLNELCSIKQRQAYFYCSLVFVRHAADPQPIIAEGIFKGEIATSPLGSGGHGYDPIFWLSKHQATVAQLEAKFKNQISHRGLALTELITKLKHAGLF